ncbi:MAG: hypothetical protein AAF940_06095 [Pseudomonadota bacterium]
MAYAIASRHSARVALLRMAVPASALLMTLGLVLALLFFRPGNVVNVAGIQLDGMTIENGRLVMANPRLEGVADGGRPYTVQARRAVQTGPAAELIELEAIVAEIDGEGAVNGTLTAESGVFERNANRLRLTGKSVFTRPDGIEAFFNSADIEVESGSLVTNDPVRVVRPGQEILAGSAEFTENGKRVIFDNGVRVNVLPVESAEEAGEQQ